MSEITSPEWLAEYTQLTQGQGAVAFENWTTLELRGKDRASFLHNFCTQDIRGMAVGTSREAFCTDVKGKIVGHFWVFCQEDRLTLWTVPHQGERLTQHLDRYLIREDVQILDRSEAYRWFGVCTTPEAEAAFETWGCDLPALTSGNFRKSSETAGAFLAKTQLLWPGIILLRVPVEGPSAVIERWPASSWDCPAVTALRVESALPLLSLDFDEANLPQEINRDRLAIHFSKGCYLGQETIARIDALGHVNKKLALVKGDPQMQEPASGRVLSCDQQVIGTIQSSCWSPRLAAPAALAFLKRGHNADGSRLRTTAGSWEVISPSDP